MPKFRRKPEEFEAVKWTGDMSAIIALVGHGLPTYGPPFDGALRIPCSWEPADLQKGEYLVKHPIYGFMRFFAHQLEGSGSEYELVEE